MEEDGEAEGEEDEDDDPDRDPSDLPIEKRTMVGSGSLKKLGKNKYIICAIRLPGEYHKMIGFHDYQERDQVVQDLIGGSKEVHEVVDGRNPCRMVGDIDCKYGGVQEDEIDSLKDVFIAVAKQEPWNVPNPEFMVCGYNRADKKSRHLLSTNFRLHDGGAVNAFNKQVKQMLLIQNKAELSQTVDEIGRMGKFSWSLRAPFCLKSDKKGKPMLNSQLLPMGNTVTDVSKWFIQQDESIPIFGPKTPTIKKEYKPVVVPDNLKEMIAKVLLKFPYFNLMERNEGTPAHYLAVFERLRPEHCYVCKRVHENAGAYILATESGAVMLRCFRADRGKSNCLMMLQPGKRSYDAQKADCFDIVLTADHINSKWISDGVPINLEIDTYLRSSWGCGKTKFAADTVKVMKTLGKTVLVVSSRKTLSAQLCNDFGATSYDSKELKGKQLDVSIHPMTVFQIESLKRIDSNIVFDLIILDEISQLIAHLNQRDGHKAEFKVSLLTKVNSLLKRAKTIMVMDNDLTERHIQAFEAVRHGRPKRVIVNDQHAFASVPVTILVEEDAWGRLHQQAMEFIDQQYQLKMQGKPYNGCVIPHHKKGNDKSSGKYPEDGACALHELINKRYGEGSAILHIADDDDDGKKEAFADAGITWSTALAVIYTSTVTVGVSANTPHISHCFAFFNNKTMAATQSAQMLFRARQLKEVRIAFQGSNFSKEPDNENDLYEWLVKRENRKYIPDPLRDDMSIGLNIFTELKTSSDSDDLRVLCQEFEGKMFIGAKLDEYRSKNNFIGRIKAILERSGMTVTLSTDVASKEVKAEIKALKVSLKQTPKTQHLTTLRK